MIRATELAGRAVVDLDAAEKIGTIDKMILDTEGRRVAGFVVARARSGFPGTKAHVVVPSNAVHAIGPDAVTIHQEAVAAADMGPLEALPKGSDVIGRKVVSEDGRFLGKVSDVLINKTDGRIHGYLLSEHTPGRKWDEMLGHDRKRRQAPFLPADTRIHPGRDLVVASEDTVNYGWADEETPLPGAEQPSVNWAYGGSTSRVEGGSDVHPMARATTDEEGVGDTARETNPRVR